MEVDERDLDLEADLPPVDANHNDQDSLQDARCLIMERHIQSLIHAYQQCREKNCRKCRDKICRLRLSDKMVRVLIHAKFCKQKARGNCRICKQLIGLCGYHAKSCQDWTCLVPYCKIIKLKFEEQRQAQLANLTRRRMAAKFPDAGPAA